MCLTAHLLETLSIHKFGLSVSMLVSKKEPVQTLDGTALRLTNVRKYKRRTRTNVGLAQMSDLYKCLKVHTSRRTSTNTRPVQTSE